MRGAKQHMSRKQRASELPTGVNVAEWFRLNMVLEIAVQPSCIQASVAHCCWKA